MLGTWTMDTNTNSALYKKKKKKKVENIQKLHEDES